MTLAWHFAGTRMRDGKPLGAPGEVEVHDGPLEMCESGLHASERLLDALAYAPGPLLRRVRLSGEILRYDDKMVASRREILWECDMSAALRLFARWCALSVRHLWAGPMPGVVLEFLMTGREDIRDAARAAAWDAAGDAASAAVWRAARAAARDAARAAACAAAWDAARDAAWDADCAAAWGAARDAAWGAACAAAWGAARDAAWGAACAAAWDAARDADWRVARGVAWGAARDAAREAAWRVARGVAWGAARDEARDAQDRRLVAYAQAARAGLFHG